MQRNVVNIKRVLYKNKKKISIITFIVFCCIIVGKIGFSYYFTDGIFNAATTINIPSFAPTVNNSNDRTQSINLSSTITNGKNLAPGAVGKFKIDVNFSNVGSNTYYRINYDRTNIPNNIKFYADETLTSEISDIYGIQLKTYSNKDAEHYIYWTWIYSDTQDSNANDSLYMNQEITVPFTAEISQKIENHTFTVNNFERPSGRIYLIGNSGSFDLNLDFNNISTAKIYKIYFDKENKSNVLHLYSDSLFQNEITSIEVNYDGVNKLVNNTIYWKLDDSSSTDLYYIVY